MLREFTTETTGVPFRRHSSCQPSLDGRKTLLLDYENGSVDLAILCDQVGAVEAIGDTDGLRVRARNRKSVG